jgi:hypothetical protein
MDYFETHSIIIWEGSPKRFDHWFEWPFCFRIQTLKTDRVAEIEIKWNFLIYCVFYLSFPKILFYFWHFERGEKIAENCRTFNFKFCYFFFEISDRWGSFLTHVRSIYLFELWREFELIDFIIYFFIFYYIIQWFLINEDSYGFREDVGLKFVNCVE